MIRKGKPMTRKEKPSLPLPQRRLLAAELAADYCGGAVESTWSKWNAAGKIPAPKHLGGRVFWDRLALDAWMDAGCPGRVKFEEMMKARAEADA